MYAVDTYLIILVLSLSTEMSHNGQNAITYNSFWQKGGNHVD